MTHPIVVLEGPNGVGKTTYARVLSDLLEIPMLRPLRQDPDNHWDGAEREALHGLHVPVNTFVDDVYAADFLVQTNQGAVLDRSMPSALVYSQVIGGEGYPAPTLAHLDWWQSRLEHHAGKVLVVFMESTLDVIQERVGSRAPTTSNFNALSRAFGKVFKHVMLPKMVITTSKHPVAQGVDMVVRKLMDADA